MFVINDYKKTYFQQEKNKTKKLINYNPSKNNDSEPFKRTVIYECQLISEHNFSKYAW